MKLLIFLFSLIFFYTGYSQKDTATNSTYDLLVKINGLDRNYSGCGFRFYAISVIGVVQNAVDKERFGDKVILTFQCPEILNHLPIGDMYKLKVTFYDHIQADEIVDLTNKDSLNRKKLLVLSTKVVPQS